MLNHVKIDALDDFFKGLNERKNKGVFFYRINGYNDTIGDFIKKYYEAARKSGVIIEGRIPNPDDKNLAYYNEIMGGSFQMNLEFITRNLKKWLPRMNDYQINTVATAIYGSLEELRKSGKNENMLKNAYIKFMCWLYYKFERIVSQLGNNDVPKILYEADISNYELILISILSNAGCDVVLLQYNGDDNYKKIDPNGICSEVLELPNMKGFPSEYCLKSVQKAIQTDLVNQRIYGNTPDVINCTNAWIKGKNVFDDIRTPSSVRGSDEHFFYNCFCRINGVEDKITYLNDLYKFNNDLKASNRKVVIVDGEVTPPSIDEINTIKRKNSYDRLDQLFMELANNLRISAGSDLQAVLRKAFLDCMFNESKKDDNINKLTNKGVYMVCWLMRYTPKLFQNWKRTDISCFIHFGPCRNENESIFLKILSKMPIDVLILVPNLNEKCVLSDSLLYEMNYVTSMNVESYPQQTADLHVGTSAYHAERELDSLMYQNTGIYRNQQFSKANIITLRTMYEEIQILWKEEVKYRPNFDTSNSIVNIPVIFAKVSGVKDGDLQSYWNGVKELMREDVFLITNIPYIQDGAPNPMKAFATEFFKNGKLQRKKIKEHKNYQYGFLREEVQEHILDKLQLLLDKQLIKGTFENGTEYTIVATVLNLSKELIRILQKFDFTKKNPKLIYINTGEKMISLEDSIIVSFLNMIGFDIVFFVPTGYQCIEKHFNSIPFEEHQIGEYVYDIQIPNLKAPPDKQSSSWRHIFKKG